ncbi:hypothetical protein QF117_09170 [Vibrio sp. YMD68]|uniref:hypothetical protein n=1 Tax=Vibrio sp. YMD68 TaxID=3042300 RepID=UPI00249B08FC|nr:hypothetical protein [Vibrio sp. YMD68]WGW00347.1 hypothetical protein QF117_21205 [Vibrio sp. YMD68]WGW00972.1 hypothetical protein QF117_09170 [Vibrio sp. YMD68]
MIPGMPSFGDVAGGLANGGPSSAESGSSTGNTAITAGGIGNRVDSSGLMIGVVVAALVIGGVLLWKLK